MTFSIFFIVLSLLLSAALIYRLSRAKTIKQPNTRKFSVQLSKSTYFKILIGFTALLVVLTIISEFTAIRKPVVALPPIAEPGLEEQTWVLINQIMNHEQVDEKFLVEKRTHPAESSLTIQHSEYAYEDPEIYIKRKNNTDWTIEEFLYKPEVIINGYDFSNLVKMSKPMWTDNTVSFPKEKSTTHFTTFKEALTLQQFMQDDSYQPDFNSYSSNVRQPILYLIVPEDVEIIADDYDYIIFTDEVEDQD